MLMGHRSFHVRVMARMTHPRAKMRASLCLSEVVRWFFGALAVGCQRLGLGCCARCNNPYSHRHTKQTVASSKSSVKISIVSGGSSYTCLWYLIALIVPWFVGQNAALAQRRDLLAVLFSACPNYLLRYQNDLRQSYVPILVLMFNTIAQACMITTNRNAISVPRSRSRYRKHYDTCQALASVVLELLTMASRRASKSAAILEGTLQSLAIAKPCNFLDLPLELRSMICHTAVNNKEYSVTSPSLTTTMRIDDYFMCERV